MISRLFNYTIHMQSNILLYFNFYIWTDPSKAFQHTSTRSSKNSVEFYPHPSKTRQQRWDFLVFFFSYFPLIYLFVYSINFSLIIIGNFILKEKLGKKDWISWICKLIYIYSIQNLKINNYFGTEGGGCVYAYRRRNRWYYMNLIFRSK